MNSKGWLNVLITVISVWMGNYMLFTFFVKLSYVFCAHAVIATTRTRPQTKILFNLN